MMGEIEKVVNGNLTWNFRWNKSFFLINLSYFDKFHALLINVILTLERDKWV